MCKDKNSCTVTLIHSMTRVALVLCTASPSIIRCPIMSTWHEWKKTFHNLNEWTKCCDLTNLNEMHFPLDSLLCRVDKHFLQSHDSYDSTTITWGLLLTSQATKLLSPLDEMRTWPSVFKKPEPVWDTLMKRYDWCFLGGCIQGTWISMISSPWMVGALRCLSWSLW